nr:MAG TPA: hypothetical protein [Caudoviricetes sp.]DAZ32443.1 MAG TPA: hypothetical protein [Caudoviricetes sp.]
MQNKSIRPSLWQRRSFYITKNLRTNNQNCMQILLFLERGESIFIC